MSEAPKKRYLVIVKFGPEDRTAARARARTAVPAFQAVLERFAGKEVQLAFFAEDASTFGYFFKTAMPLRVVQCAAYGEDNRSTGTAALLRGDDWLALELGRDFDGRGFSRAWTWLQHH